MKCIVCIFVFVINFLCCVHLVIVRTKSKYSVIVEEVVKCSEQENFSINITQLGRGLQSIDSKVWHPRMIKKVSAVGKIWRCPWESRYNCEMILRAPIDDICFFLEAPSFFTSELKKITPEYKCPLEGEYRGTNMTINTEGIYQWFTGAMGEDIHSISFLWIDLVMYEEPSKEKVLCVSTALRIISVKVAKGPKAAH